MSAHNNVNNGRQRVFVYFAIHHPYAVLSTLFHDHDRCFSPLRIVSITGILALGWKARTNRHPTRTGRNRTRWTVNKPIRRNYFLFFSAFVFLRPSPPSPRPLYADNRVYLCFSIFIYNDFVTSHFHSKRQSLVTWQFNFELNSNTLLTVWILVI